MPRAQAYLADFTPPAAVSGGGGGYTRQQRRLLGGGLRISRGLGAFSPRTTHAAAGAAAGGPPRRQQPWQMCLPAGVPAPPLTAEGCRNQVMADLVYLFK
jgi:hypothetical protein